MDVKKCKMICCMHLSYKINPCDPKSRKEYVCEKTVHYSGPETVTRCPAYEMFMEAQKRRLEKNTENGK